MGLLKIEKNVPTFDLNTATFVLYGDQGLGKTTLIDGMGDVLHLDGERRALGVKGWREDIVDWPWLEKLLPELPNHPCKTVSVDPFAVLWNHCAAHYCKGHNIPDLMSEEGYKTGFGVVATTIHNWLLKLLKLKRVALVCHSTFYETPVHIPGKEDVMKRKWVPECGGTAGTGKPHIRMHDIMGKIAGVEIYMEMDANGKRVLHCNPSDKWDATVKLTRGKLPDSIVIEDGENGYEVLKRAIEEAQKTN